MSQPSGEPVAWVFQHDESGRIQFVDKWQIEQGFEKNNPRWNKCDPLYTHPAPVGSELTDKEIAEAYATESDYPFNTDAVRAVIAADRAKRNESTREAVIEECAKAIEPDEETDEYMTNENMHSELQALYDLANKIRALKGNAGGEVETPKDEMDSVRREFERARESVSSFYETAMTTKLPWDKPNDR